MTYPGIIPKFKSLNQVSVFSYKNFEPIIYDQGLGYEADLLKAIFKWWNVAAVFYPSSDYENIWLKPGEKNSKFDITAAGLDPGCHAEKNVVYSIPTAKYSQSLLILKKNFPHKIKDFYSFQDSNLQIGVLGNTSGEIYGFQRVKNLNINPSIFKRYETESDLINALDKGEIYAIARGTIGNEYQELKNDKYMTIEQQSFGESLAYSIDPANAQLKKTLDQSIELLTNKNKISYKEWLSNPQIFATRLTQLS